METKTANVTACIQSDIKESVEAIAMRDTLSLAEFNTVMEKGLKQAKADESVFVENAFASLKSGI